MATNILSPDKLIVNPNVVMACTHLYIENAHSKLELGIGPLTKTMGLRTFLSLIVFTCSIALAIGACPKIISRKEWEAEPPEGREVLKGALPYLAIHHTYIPGFCSTTTECKRAMKSMQNYHKNILKWGDIGYSFCIGGDGNVYEGRGWGVVGAHTYGWNRHAIGLCLIGDYTKEMPTSKMLRLIDELVDCGTSNNHLKKDVKYFGHRQVCNTSCPGDKLYNYVTKLPRWTAKPVK